jgi:uncharacterized repeat protein (TIGR02543 family)
MKTKVSLILAALLTLAFGACSDDNANSGGNPQNPNNPYMGNYSAEFRGEWIRMDNGDRWYIDGKTITVNDTGSFPAVTLEKKSENVTVATGADKTKYTLFGARIANADFIAEVKLLDDSAGQKPPVKISNPKQPDLPPLVVQPNQQTGIISVSNQIPGDRLEIVPNSSEWSGNKVYLTPGFGKQQNLGVIPLTRGDNFKMSVRMESEEDDITELYADFVPRNYIIELENIGTTNGDAGWELSWNDEDFLYLSGKTVEDYTNIAPGEKKQLTLRLASRPITTATKSKEIKAAIWHYDAKSHTPKEWDDTVAINFHNTPVPFRFSSVKQVQGIIKTSKGKSYYFRTNKETSADYTTEVYVPWSDEPYTVAFLGATIESDSATKYSFAIDDQPPVNWSSINSMDFLEKYKPDNEYETTAPVLDLTTGVKSFMGYLASDSIDYYKVKLANTPSAVKIYTVSFNGNGATSGTAPADVTWGNGTVIQLPGKGDIERTGYVFEGWNTDRSGTGTNYEAGSSYTITGNATLYAKWHILYTVTFDRNEATSGTTPVPLTGFYGTVVQFPNHGDMEKTGSLFCGWNTMADGTGTLYIAGSSYTIAGNITLYAIWGVPYTITFDKNNATADGIEAAPQTITIIYPLKTTGTLPEPPRWPYYSFTGWNTEADGSGTVFTEATIVTESITVYAQWVENIVPGETLEEKFNWLQTNAASNTAYSVIVTDEENLILNKTLSYSGKINVTIRLQGDNNMRTVSSLSENSHSYLFAVNSGVTLILENNITLKDSYAISVVLISSGGALVMREGSVITGNNRSSSSGGGVFVDNGIFTMNGGKIKGSNATISNEGRGGGVYVNGGTFTMNDGEISGNYASERGGGVYVNTGTFTMNNGKISGNTVYGRGNTLYLNGGGGVHVYRGTFMMNGGEISGNTAYSGRTDNVSRGGGVYVYSGDFKKTGGIIYGYTADDTNSNYVSGQSSNGHAVFIQTPSIKRREITAGPTVNLDSSKNGADGGW